ncbi:MAG: adenylate/guanylate cyclase domain-containing protein [Acidimicrobiia bacterium]
MPDLAGERLDRQFKLEWLLVWIRWVGLAVLAYANTHTSTTSIYPEPSTGAVAAAQAVTGAAALVNGGFMFILRSRSPARLQGVRAAALISDVIVLEATLFLVGRPLGQTWGVLVLLPLEAGLKYLLRGSLTVAGLVAVGEVVRELYLGSTISGYDASGSGVGARIVLVVLVAFFAGNLQSALERESHRFQRAAEEEAKAKAALDREHRLLQAEREKSERLLLNVLPRAIADRLKASEEVIADSFPEASVLFADIVGFTPYAQRTPPEEVVRVLNELFSVFDGLADRYGLEKIKTIGDAYMVAGGIPEPRPDHAESVADMALSMVAEVERRSGDAQELRLRIGIDTGPVIAGVIGRRKFIYDLWGDTVNTASRMEAHGIPGSIQVTERTYRRLAQAFALEKRGVIEVKGKGPTTVYLLKGRRTARTGLDQEGEGSPGG